MQKIEIDTHFGDKAAHVEISAPHGTGAATFHVMINKYYNGSLMKAVTVGECIYIHNYIAGR